MIPSTAITDDELLVDIAPKDPTSDHIKVSQYTLFVLIFYIVTLFAVHVYYQ